MVLRVTSLKVNNLDTPLGIDTTPLFGWVNRCDGVGKYQTACQILVASTTELAASRVGDLWDSGKLECTKNFDIPYAGVPLPSQKDCYWTVRVWDEEDAVSRWSEIARFGTGILQRHLWQGKWIGGQMQTAGRETAPAPMLRKAFSVKAPVKNAKVFVCGLGLFELTVNGKMPDDSVLKPADTQYEDTVSYCAYDVTQLLIPGKNAIAVELGGGYYNLPDPISVKFHTGVWRDDPKLLLQLRIEYENGDTETVASDESWRCWDDGPVRRNSIYCGEIYDAEKEVAGWTCPDFDDSGWSPVRMAAAPAGVVKFENMEPMRRIKTVTPVVQKTDDGAWLVYLGEFCTGWAKIAFTAPKGTEIRIRYFQREFERKKGLHTGIGGSGAIDCQLQCYVYRCKGVPGETYEPKFSYCGYELIEITGYSGELKAEDVACYMIATDADRIGMFEAGNDHINRLHEIMVRTMVCNMQGKPTDTPIFEKLGWTGDYNGAIKTFNFNFDTNNFLAHFLHNLRDTALETGQVNEYSPSGQIATWYDAPCWTQMYINSIYAAWHENGQFSLVREHYDFMRRQVEYWLRKISGGEQPWIWEAVGINNRLGDWASPNGSLFPSTAPAEGGFLYNTAAVYRVLGEFAEISEAMGLPAERYREAAQNIYNAFNRTFYNAEKGYYETEFWNGSTTRTRYRQSCNLVPLYFGLCPEEYHDSVLDSLVKDIVSKNYHLDVGHIGAQIILPLLSEENLGQIAIKILMQTDHPSWGYWLSRGSTTAWEGWSDRVRSYCHFFLGTYDEWFYQNLAGIRQPRNGYETVTIQPEIYPELGYVKASVCTVRGELVSSWQVDGENRLTMTVTVPVGTTADIVLPVSAKHGLRLNGTPLTIQTGVLEISTRNGKVLVRVGSGTYYFDLGTNAIMN